MVQQSAKPFWKGCVVCGVLLLMGNAYATAEPPQVYLSDVLDELVFFHTQSWGALGIDTAVQPTDGRAAMPLRIKDAAYDKGLGHHANGEIVVELNGAYTAFEAEVGVQAQGQGQGSVVFQVFVDDEKRFDSGILREADAAMPVRVPLEGADILRLVVTDAGDGIMCDCANWANARLIGGAPENRPAPERVDVARFARVVTCDPHRNDGARSSRVQQFHPEDVFLETPIFPRDNAYTVPTVQDGTGCIGLQWAETRLLRELAVEFLENAPTPDGVQVQYWTGESPWQGAWQPFQGNIETGDGRWTFAVNRKENPGFPASGSDKIRWIFPPRKEPIKVKSLLAFTNARWSTASLRLEIEQPSGQNAAQSAGNNSPPTSAVEVYNGEFVSGTSGEKSLRATWPLSGPLEVTVRYSKPRTWKADRTVLRVQLPGGACGVAVEDVLSHKAVYVRDLGLYVVPSDAAMNVADYRKSIEGRKTVLERVREMPDQTFAGALEKTHNPIQNNGPMMLSLACDNRKFIAHRDGTVQFDPGWKQASPEGGSNPTHRMTPTFGSRGTPSPSSASISRKLDGGWLPAPVTTVQDNGVIYRQTSFVVPAGQPLREAPAWLDTQPLCVVNFEAENTRNVPADISVKLALTGQDLAPRTRKVPRGAIACQGNDVLLLVDAEGAGPLSCTADDAGIAVAGVLPAGAQGRWTVYIPGWKVADNAYDALGGGTELRKKLETYWNAVLEQGAHIDVPDEMLRNVIRASQVHCYLAARNEVNSNTVAAWIASDRYGPLESEAHAVILGMDLMGQSVFSRKALDFFINRYNNEGFLTTGYTLMGTGWHLWTLARHYALTDDKEWFKAVAPRVALVCRWILDQCKKTTRMGDDPEVIPEQGLVPPGVGADWNRFAYRFSIQANYYAGLNEAACALHSIRFGSEGLFVEKARSFRDDILRAYHWNQARSPVLALSDGTWVPAYGGMLYGFGATGEMIPGEDGNRSWAYDVELGSHHLIPLGVIAPDSREADGIMEHMEDVWFLKAGMGDYPEDKSQADWFDFGGFSKVQPYYTRNAEISALRDDVKPFIRSYFNALASQLSVENLSLWEHFHNIGAWNKTHETGWFLVQTRTMFVAERGDELWLAPFVTNAWLGNGMSVTVENAPTRFGPVSYRIASHVDEGYIEANITPPLRQPPLRLVIRLRHPQGLPIRSVTVNGQPHTDFDPKKECVALVPVTEPIIVRADF